jgi:hypothetical protein
MRAVERKRNRTSFTICHIFHSMLLRFLDFFAVHTAYLPFFSMEVNSSMINRFTAKSEKLLYDTLLIAFSHAFREISREKRISFEMM